MQLILQVGLILLVLLLAASSTQPELKRPGTVIGMIIAAVVAWQVIATIMNLSQHWNDLEPHAVISLFLLPLWLSVGTLPFVYLLGLYAGYEVLFKRMDIAVDGRASLASRLGVAMELRGRPHRFQAASGQGTWEAARSGTFRGARQAIRGALIADAIRRVKERTNSDRIESAPVATELRGL